MRENGSHRCSLLHLPMGAFLFLHPRRITLNKERQNKTINYTDLVKHLPWYVVLLCAAKVNRELMGR